MCAYQRVKRGSATARGYVWLMKTVLERGKKGKKCEFKIHSRYHHTSRPLEFYSWPLSISLHLNFLCHLSSFFCQSSLNTFHSPPLCVCILIFRQKYSLRTLTFSPCPTAPNLTLILLSPSQLLCIDVQKRISCLAELQELDYMSDVNWDAVLNKQLPPGFIPNASIRNYSSALLIYIRPDCWYNLLANLTNSDESDWSINIFFKLKMKHFKHKHLMYSEIPILYITFYKKRWMHHPLLGWAGILTVYQVW